MPFLSDSAAQEGHQLGPAWETDSAWRLSRSRHWPVNIRRLFPELAPGRATRSQAVPDMPARPRGHTVVLAQAELAAPPFRSGAFWISGRVAAIHRDGETRPGWLAQAVLDPSGDAARGQTLQNLLARARVGGTFWAAPPDLPQSGLIALGCLPDAPAAAADLIAALLAHHAAARIVLLASSAAAIPLARAAGCHVVVAPCDPWPLLDRVEEVHVADETPLALLALAAGRRLVCHAPGAMASGNALAPGALAAAALLGAARHADPFHDRLCTPEEAIAILADWRRLGAVGQGIGSVISVAFWKRREVMAMLDHGAGVPVASKDPARAVDTARLKGGAVLAWPSTMPPALPKLAAAARVPVWQIEDGFVRSVGLGANSTPPHSLVIDRRGIYFDPATLSDLEILLQETLFPPDLLTRAAAVIDCLVTRQITKYNTGGNDVAFYCPPGRRVVVVPGQVSDDRSVVLGGMGIGDNLTLLALVRAQAPDAFIVYKPHPDVDAGQRAGSIPDAAAQKFADRIVRGVALPRLIGRADEVHTLTSLSGFEALLRRKPVTTYGQPFFAGWGLTTDLAPLPRRTRRLTLEELVAGTLLLYPRYLDPVTGLPCPLEVLLERLADPTLWRAGARVRLRQAFGHVRGWLKARIGAMASAGHS